MGFIVTLMVGCMSNQSKRYCWNCGNRLSLDSIYCTQCGIKIKLDSSNTKDYIQPNNEKTEINNLNNKSQYRNTSENSNIQYAPRPPVFGMYYKRFTPSNIIRGALNLYLKNLKRLLPLYLIYVIIVFLISDLLLNQLFQYLGFYYIFKLLNDYSLYYILIIIGALFLSYLFIWIPDSMNYSITADYTENKSVAILTDINNGIRRLPQLILLYLIYFVVYLGIVGFYFLLVLSSLRAGFAFAPLILLLINLLSIFLSVFSIYVNLKLFLTVPNIIINNQNPIDALKSSWKSTHGNLISIFVAKLGYGVILGISYFVIMGIIGSVASRFFPNNILEVIVIAMIIFQILLLPLSSLFNTSVYYLEKFDKGNLKYQFLYEPVPKT